MHRFHYRHPRFPVDFTAQFAMEDETVPCRCIDMSVTGMTVELTTKLATGSCGKLSFYDQNREIKLNARVAYGTSRRSGLEFLGDSDEAQEAIAGFIDSLSEMRDHRLILMAPRPR